jgi:hypothetical protein
MIFAFSKKLVYECVISYFGVLCKVFCFSYLCIELTMVQKRSFIVYCNSVTCLVIIFQLGKVELVISLLPFNIITFNNYGDCKINSHIHFALSRTQS